MTISVSQTNNGAVNTNQMANSDLKDETRLVPNTLKNKVKASYQKTTSAFTEYPAKGFKGSKKSNFYEFLSMGTVPYLVGSAAFMAVFAGAFKSFKTQRLAMGVVFYGLAKTLSKSLISTPVKMATGIDTEMAYERHVYTDPKANVKKPVNEYEQHKVMESHDFPRYDMMYGEKVGKPHNYLFDEIAKKNGLGENLPSSDTEVKPLIKDVISRSSTAKSISSYLWAAAGVALAAQTPWNHFFRAASKENWNKYKPSAPDLKWPEKLAGKTVNTAKNIWRIAGSFGRSLVDSSKELYKGPDSAKGFNKHAGKGLLALAALSSIIGAANTIYGAKTAVGQNKNVFDRKEKVTVQ
ncbi:MAG: hypothetical protein LUB59_01475 [Candidatus Gastranaerophilales bacterium]|nr:hypothetical protein [Candidatus Gastranaerophilales bacterium]